MKICGLQKTTLLDYPGHVAATIFLGGCNFRCPFCYNGGLLGNDAKETMKMNELFSFLRRRRTVLEGVCITGGEPTLSSGLEDLIREIKRTGYLVKLDTNGCRPDILKDLSRKGLLDYVAMDIKAGRENYPRAAGFPGIDIGKIEESALFLINGSVPYEFRTTAVKGLHGFGDFLDIGRWLEGCSHYYLQNYLDTGNVLCSGLSPCTKEELLTFAGILKRRISDVSLRGINC